MKHIVITLSMVALFAGKSQAQDVLLFPDFFHYNKAIKKDTTWEYQCFDKKSHPVYFFNLHDVDVITHVEYLKIALQNNVVKNSMMSPAYIHQKISVWEHPNPDTWIGVVPKTAITTKYKLYKDKIVRTEKVTLHDINGRSREVLLKYYKTEAIKK